MPTIDIRVGSAINIFSTTYEGSWWIGRVQAMKRHNGHMFGVVRQPVLITSWPKSKNLGIEILTIAILE